MLFLSCNAGGHIAPCYLGRASLPSCCMTVACDHSTVFNSMIYPQDPQDPQIKDPLGPYGAGATWSQGHMGHMGPGPWAIGPGPDCMDFIGMNLDAF